MPTAASSSAPPAESIASSSSSSDEIPTQGVDLTADDEWQDVASDNEELTFVSLFEDANFASLEEMLEHDRTRWGFDLKGEILRLGVDFYGCVRLVNYIRSETKKGAGKTEVLTPDTFEDDGYLKPVLEDDAVLFCLDELAEAAGGTAADAVNGESSSGRVAELEAQLEQLQGQFAEYRSTVEKALDERWESRDAVSPEEIKKAAERQMDSEYFDSYAYYDIHATMIKDEVRTDAYRDFIYDNKHLFDDRIVLDIGCGTGILSLFAAKAGARHVYAVDNSEIINKAREIVLENNLQDKITCIRGRIEDITLPTVPPGHDAANTTTTGRSGKPVVDIIVSEWMGYCLLYENMLDSILHARDTYLAPPPSTTTSNAPAPLIAPSHTTLHIAPLADPDYVADHIAFWDSVYGFRMRAMQRDDPPPGTRQRHPDVLMRAVDAASLLAPSARFSTLDLRTCTRADLEWPPAPFSLILAAPAPAGLDGFALWFDAFFLARAGAALPPDARAEAWPPAAGVAFTTGPRGPQTHWMQGCLMLDRARRADPAAVVPLAAGMRVVGTVAYRRGAANARELEIEVAWDVEGTAERGRQTWVLR